MLPGLIIVLIGIFITAWGIMYLFGSDKTIKKFIDWNLSYSVLDLKSRKKLGEKPKKLIKITGLFMILIGIFMIGLGFWVTSA